MAQQNAEDWDKARDDLKAEIALRHYSPKTLRSYKNWVIKFQGFNRNKTIKNLTLKEAKSPLDF